MDRENPAGGAQIKALSTKIKACASWSLGSGGEK